MEETDKTYQEYLHTQDIMDWKLPPFIHPLLSSLYVTFLVCITVFWPSISMIVLLCTHGALVIAILFSWTLFGDGKLPSYITGGYNKVGRSGQEPTIYSYAVELLSFHFTHPQTTWFNIIHLVILIANFAGFLTVTHNSAPPSTLKLPSRPFDHSLFGVSTGGILTEQEDLSLQKLAQTGFYYADRYYGKFGTSPGVTCNSASGWHCYAVGIRHDMDNGKTFYQPLLTPSYDVDVQVAVSVGLHPADKCVSLSPIFIQHVKGDGNPVDFLYKPLVDSAWDKARTLTVCPPGTGIGCIENQRQTYEELTKSIQTLCQSDESIVHHVTDGFKYDASYLKISAGDTLSVDETNGEITHTILIMSNKTVTPPVLRVTMKQMATGLPLGNLFRSLGGWNWPTRGSVDDNGMAKSDAQEDLRYKHTYGNLNAPDKALADVSVPYEYLNVNYKSTFWLYCTFFAVPIVISWYYLVTTMEHYKKMPFIMTALLVRLPLLIISIYASLLWYTFAQITLIMAHLIRSQHSLPSDSKRLFGYTLVIAVSVIWNIVHFALWFDCMADNKMNLMIFTKYHAERISQINVVGEWDSQLFLPLMVIFFFIEPMVSIVCYGLLALKNSSELMSRFNSGRRQRY